MNPILAKIATVLSGVILTIGGAFGIVENQTPIENLSQKVTELQVQLDEINQNNLGATIPVVNAKFETSLASGITASDTSMTLVKGTNTAGTTISGYMCFTIDEGSASEETVCGTASSTSITSMLRGIDPIDGDLEVAALKKPHRRGMSVKQTDHPPLTIALRILNGDETLPNKLVYTSTIGTSSFTNAQQLVSKGYVDATAFAGAPVGSDSVAGIGIFSTRAQLSAGTATSSYGGLDYLLIPKNEYFSSTSTATTTAVVTKTNGKINQNFLDLTEGLSLSGGVTSTGATSLATTTINNTLNVTGTSTLAGVSATNLSVSGAITGSVTSPSYIGQAGFNSSNASSSRVISGLSFTPQRVTVFGGQSGGYTTGFGFSGGYGTATSSQKSSFLNNGCGAGSSSNTVFYTANIRNFSGNPCDATLSVSISAMGTSSVTLSEASQGADAGSASYTYIIE
jgi:hypothetical protein